MIHVIQTDGDNLARVADWRQQFNRIERRVGLRFCYQALCRFDGAVTELQKFEHVVGQLASAGAMQVDDVGVPDHAKMNLSVRAAVANQFQFCVLQGNRYEFSCRGFAASAMVSFLRHVDDPGVFRQ